MAGSKILDRYDVVVAGARCAGASTAMLLARAGMSVLVVDPLPRGRDTLSTHALMRGGVMQLARWGLLDAIKAANTPTVRSTSFHYGSERIDIPIKEADGIDGLYSPRRTVLDPIVAAAAEEAGAQVMHGASVTDVIRDGDGRVIGAVIGGAKIPSKRVRADVVVGADGVRSRVARIVAADVLHSVHNTAATMFGYWPGLGIEENNWYFDINLGAGAIPTNDGDTIVFASIPPDTFRATPHSDMRDLYLRTVQAADPALHAALLEVRQEVRLRAFAGLPGFIRQSVGPGWVLVGDAGFFRDPLTAHGITDAFREAELLARALLAGETELNEYESRRDERIRDLLEITDQVCSFDWDLPRVQELHLDLSRAMNVGVQAIRDLDAVAGSSAAVPANA